MKYYYVNNASRTIKTPAVSFKFEPVSLIGGVPDGVFKTDSPQLITVLDALVAAGKVIEKTQVQYDELIQKKTLINSSQRSVIPAPEPFTGSLVAPVEVAKKEPDLLPSLPKIEKVEDAINVGRVTAAESFVPKAKRQTKRSRKTLL